MPKLLERILRMGDKKILRQLDSYAQAVNLLEEEFAAMTDEELRTETDKLKERYEQGETLDQLLPEAFATVREAASRTLGMRPFDVQIMGGAALHLGNIAEMKTGEGKTLVATLPAFLNALTGKGVHVVTVNDYLAEYQSELMGRIFRFLGMSTGCILSAQNPTERRKQYAADITYGTNNEFGFDYLRDNMAWSPEELVQRGHNFAIVDEVDSILIDEARTPLIISGQASGDVNRWYTEFASLVKRLKRDEDYEVDEKKRTVGVLESGIEKVEDYLGISNLYESANTPLIGFLNNAIKAKEIFKLDKDYVVLDGEVMIVDEHTGRILAGRRYSEGIHQAIEAKEGVQIKAENQTLATVTLQNYFRLYEKLSGMTGTAETEAAEFMNTYNLGVVPIPTNLPMQRLDTQDLIYASEVSKFDAVVEDIVERYKNGQPVLVGTTSVEKSEYLSKLLAKAGVRHEVLNAKNHAREAAIVAQAGRQGAITVATNMAGRGTDIMLGGNAEHNAVAQMEKLGLDPEENAEEYEKQWPAVFSKAQADTEAEGELVRELGGLYVLGTERHESRRIDNQLRGRSGRQGDPGESRFYLSLQDDLIRVLNPGFAENFMKAGNIPDDVPIESKMVTRMIASVQSQAEGRNAEQRKNVLKYDDVLNRQRETIYTDRRRILEGDDLHEMIEHFRDDAIQAIVAEASTNVQPEDIDLAQLINTLKTVYPVTLSKEELLEEAGSASAVNPAMLTEEFQGDARVAYQEREEKVGSEAMRELERRVVLSVIGRKWQEHLYEMDYLKEGIGLRAMAQRDPLVEYQREGFGMFSTMMESIREESVGYLFNLDVQVTPASGEQSSSDSAAPVLQAAGLERPREPESLQFSAATAEGTVETKTRRTQDSASPKDRRSGNPQRRGANQKSAGTKPKAKGGKAKRKGKS